MNGEEHQVRSIEMEARICREIIYGPATEKNWQACEANWVADLIWLRMTAARTQRESKRLEDRR